MRATPVLVVLTAALAAAQSAPINGGVWVNRLPNGGFEKPLGSGTWQGSGSFLGGRSKAQNEQEDNARFFTNMVN